METVLIAVWLFGWIAATVCAAAFIGNVKNHPSDKTENFPAFLFPLFFGWFWPAMLALIVVIAPLAWLSDRATAKAGREASEQGQ
jgi:hypothetical protein